PGGAGRRAARALRSGPVLAGESEQARQRRAPAHLRSVRPAGEAPRRSLDQDGLRVRLGSERPGGQSRGQRSLHRGRRSRLHGWQQALQAARHGGDAMRCTLGLAFLLALVAAGAAHAQTIHSPAFLPNSGGARAYALSGAEVALANDAGAAFVNPARLCFVHGSSFVLGYARLVEDIPSDRGEFSYWHPLGDSIGAPFQRESVYRTALAGAAEYQRLQLAQGSEYAEVTGSLAGAIAPANILAFGLALRALRTNSSDVDGL